MDMTPVKIDRLAAQQGAQHRQIFIGIGVTLVVTKMYAVLRHQFGISVDDVHAQPAFRELIERRDHFGKQRR